MLGVLCLAHLEHSLLSLRNKQLQFDDTAGKQDEALHLGLLTLLDVLLGIPHAQVVLGQGEVRRGTVEHGLETELAVALNEGSIDLHCSCVVAILEG